ncbi:dihydrofolate reductase family protein [Hymenobacter sp.]|uniref:dihydrofolate reductase family protein n=1 Tax=Hymenobacter sp. TaxID=1898978 RepID=UPI00286CEF83|nr:dihydrofolate reductase family protein [Hymenobacter sp.]
MKKLILQEYISVDGFCADRDKTTGFFDGTYHTLGKDVDAHQGAFTESIDLILFGANTYKIFAEYWPKAKKEDSHVTEAMNSIPKIVFSKSLKKVQWGDYGNISLTADDAVTHIKSLRKKEDKNIIVWGSLSLAQSLLKANLFDEIQLITVPVAIGRGYKLFPEEYKLFSLKLTSYKTFYKGEILHIYQPDQQAE